MSLDPAMRAWLNDTKRSYTAPVKLGSVMRSGGLGVVVKTGEGSTLSVGDEVYGTIGKLFSVTMQSFADNIAGWSEFAVMNDKDLTKLIVPKGAEVLDYLGVLGSAGLTAYFVSIVLYTIDINSPFHRAYSTLETSKPAKP